MFWTEAAVLNAFARAALPDAAEDGGWVGLPVYDRDRPFQLSYRGYFKKLSFTL